MSAWRPTRDGRIHCTRHDETFPRGRQCKGCDSDPPPKEREDEQQPETDVLSVADHERRFCELADLAERWAQDEADGGGEQGPNRSTAQRLLDTAIKARRAAAELARAREDWQSVERLERTVQLLHRRAPAEARH